MKRILPLALILMLHLGVLQTLYGQTRQNDELPKITTTGYTELKTATGWLKNADGQWISRPNRIPISHDAADKKLVDFRETGLGIDNFVSYQFRKMTYKNKSYAFSSRYPRVGNSAIVLVVHTGLPVTMLVTSCSGCMSTGNCSI